MSRKTLLLLLVVFILVLAVTAPALAANPPGTGQPSQSCEEQPNAPAGFSTAGFSHAETVYAGSAGNPSAANGNPHAVSQYDVACFQVSQH